MRVVGIDLSLTGTGLAEIRRSTGPTESPWDIMTKVITSKPVEKPTLQDHFDRQTKICSSIMEFALGPLHFTSPEKLPDLVVIETLFNSATNAGMLIERAGLWWRIVGSLLCYNIPVVQANQSQGKKFLTGNGACDKGAMTMTAARLYPHWNPSTIKNTNDEADAIALASIAAGLMLDVESWPFPETDYRHKVVDDLDKKQLRGRIATT